MQGHNSCQKMTKAGEGLPHPVIGLAKNNKYLCYFLHKVKILTPLYHKWSARTVIWIKFIFTDMQVYFLTEVVEIWCDAS